MSYGSKFSAIGGFSFFGVNDGYSSAVMPYIGIFSGLYTVNLPRLFTLVFTAVRLTTGIPWSRATIYRTV